MHFLVRERVPTYTFYEYKIQQLLLIIKLENILFLKSSTFCGYKNENTLQYKLCKVKIYLFKF